MSRHSTREQIFKILFQIEFNEKEELPQLVEFYFQGKEQEVSEEDREYISGKCIQIVEHIDEIDSSISSNSIGWDINRLGKVELTLLRIAVYEILYDDSVPASVAINEAVEFSKKYGPEDSYKFVNGLLAKIVKD